MSVKQLPVPKHFDSKNAGDYQFGPDVLALRDAGQKWRKTQGIKPSGGDKIKVHLLLIDLQRDFCFPKGSLFVGGQSGKGAIDDNRRVAEFIYKNLGVITDITCTMDTHFTHQIFFPSFWVDSKGNWLQPHTMINVAPDNKTLQNITPAGDIISEGVLPDPAIANWICNGDYPWLCKQAFFYNQELARGVPGRPDKYMLYLWPEHCILGSDGHSLAGIIQEARLFHSYVRSAKNIMEIKGGNHLAENYSIFAMEVLMRHDGKPLGQRNARFVKTLLEADVVIIAGQAKSHCMAWTIADLLTEINSQDPALAKKVYLLGDCTSPVVVPGVVDFTKPADQAFERFVDAKMNLVNSTDPIDSWLGINL